MSDTNFLLIVLTMIIVVGTVALAVNTIDNHTCKAYAQTRCENMNQEYISIDGDEYKCLDKTGINSITTYQLPQNEIQKCSIKPFQGE